jgi:hypothetical protein
MASRVRRRHAQVGRSQAFGLVAAGWGGAGVFWVTARILGWVAVRVRRQAVHAPLAGHMCVHESGCISRVSAGSRLARDLDLVCCIGWSSNCRGL